MNYQSSIDISNNYQQSIIINHKSANQYQLLKINNKQSTIKNQKPQSTNNYLQSTIININHNQ